MCWCARCPAMISSKVESNDSYTSEDTSVDAADVAEKGGVPPRRERGIRVVFKVR